MARAPRAHIPKTSGQGVSRLSYQKGYSMAHGRDTPKIDSGGSTGNRYEKPAKIKASGRTGYDKGSKSDMSAGPNIAPFLPADLQAIMDFGSGVSNRPSAKLDPGEIKPLRK